MQLLSLIDNAIIITIKSAKDLFYRIAFFSVGFQLTSILDTVNMQKNSALLNILNRGRVNFKRVCANDNLIEWVGIKVIL